MGLLHDKGEEELCQFLEQIEGEPRDLLGPMHQQLLMHCFNEVPHSKSESQLENHRVCMGHRCRLWASYCTGGTRACNIISIFEFFFFGLLSTIYFSAVHWSLKTTTKRTSCLFECLILVSLLSGKLWLACLPKYNPDSIIA